MLRKITIIAVVLALLAGAVVVGGLYLAATRDRTSADIEVDIPQGATVRRIADELAAAGVIRTPRLFEVVVRAKRAGGKLRAGLYRFPAGTTMSAAIGKLERGDVEQFPFTVIEGWTIKEIAAALAGQRFLVSDAVPAEVLRLAADPAFIASLGFEGLPSLEGFLFPDTYFLTRPTTAEALLRRLVARFRDVWTQIGGPAQHTGLTELQLVTLASIVEKETGGGAERPIVASVFYNRLRSNMPLQSDPTIIYGLADYDGNIRKRDITNPHPYNTYVHPGLPPGPISNPGRAALEAVLHPAQSDYLYFVSRNDTTHQFSKTLAEHIEAVQRYQLRR